MLTRALALTALTALATSCAARQPAPDGDVARRLAVVEQQLAAQQRALDELRQAQRAAPELHAILDRLGELSRAVDELQSDDHGAAPPPPVPYRPRPQPDPALVYAVPLGTSPSYGPASAKVTIVMAMEFACPYCRRAYDTVEQLRKEYGKDLRVVYKSFVVHPQTANRMAIAACAANHQHRWHELADLLWTKAFDARDFSDANIDAIAKEARLDLRRYRADVGGPCPAEVRDDAALLARFGVGATPTFFINGRYLAGAQPIENFRKLIDEERAKAATAIKHGVKPARYYADEIVGKGLPKLAP